MALISYLCSIKLAMESLLDYGYVGLFLGSFLAATVFPFSSDALLLGMLAVGGNPIASVAVATIGNWLGGLTSYWVGWLGKLEWLERWFRVKSETIERHSTTVQRWGSWLALLTWLPFVGDVFAIVLGFYKARFIPSALWMFVGKCGRFIVWALLFAKI
jgi:membrane protein YqaA with SNARE-associated domain